MEVNQIWLPRKSIIYSDVALLKLENKIDYKGVLHVMPVCLPQPMFDNDSDIEAWTMGYNFYYNRLPETKR